MLGVLSLVLIAVINAMNLDMDLNYISKREKRFDGNARFIVQFHNLCYITDIIGIKTCSRENPDAGRFGTVYYFFNTQDDAIKWINVEAENYLISVDRILENLKLFQMNEIVLSKNKKTIKQPKLVQTTEYVNVTVDHYSTE
jgi:hypothetical protein